MPATGHATRYATPYATAYGGFVAGPAPAAIGPRLLLASGGYLVLEQGGFLLLDGVTPPLPADLAAAIVAVFDATPELSGEGAFTAIYRDEAGEVRPTVPWLTFSIRRGPLALATSDSRWHDDRVKFTAWSDSGEAANALAEGPVLDAFNGVALRFARGVTTPFIEGDRSQGKAPGRAPGGKLAFWYAIEFSVRARTGQP